MLTDKLSAFISHDPATYRVFIVYLFFIYLFVYCCKFGCRATGLRVGSTLIIMDNGNREDPLYHAGPLALQGFLLFMVVLLKIATGWKLMVVILAIDTTKTHVISVVITVKIYLQNSE